MHFYSDVTERSKSEALELVSCVVLRVQEKTVERHMFPLYFFLVLLPTFFNVFACSVLTPFGRGKAQQIKKKKKLADDEKKKKNHELHNISFFFCLFFSLTILLCAHANTNKSSNNSVSAYTETSAHGSGFRRRPGAARARRNAVYPFPSQSTQHRRGPAVRRLDRRQRTSHC